MINLQENAHKFGDLVGCSKWNRQKQTNKQTSRLLALLKTWSLSWSRIAKVYLEIKFTVNDNAKWQ